MANWSLIRGKAIRKNILSHIIRRHPSILVSFIEKVKNIYKVRLFNGKRIKFDADGIHIDTKTT